MFGFGTERTKVPEWDLCEETIDPEHLCTDRSSAGLMNACCLRSVPRDSTLLGGTGQFEREQGEGENREEAASELEEVDEVLHTGTITQKATRRWLFAISVVSGETTN